MFSPLAQMLRGSQPSGLPIQRTPRLTRGFLGLVLIVTVSACPRRPGRSQAALVIVPVKVTGTELSRGSSLQP